MISDIFETKSDYINKQGTHFWLDKISTNYAKQLGLKNIIVYYLKDKKEYKTRVIIEKEKYIFESQKLQEILVHLDIIKLQREY